MEQTVIQIGNSAGVIIPKQLRLQANIKLGDLVILEQDQTGHSVIIHKKGGVAASHPVTPEFLSWLDGFNKRYGKALKELAQK